MRYIRKGAVMLFLLALTGCSKDEAGNDSGAPVPVRFEAGSPEVFKTRSLIESESALQGAGFGVFAYYTGATAWGDVGSSTTPNFMYNQQVTWDGTNSVWTYTPVKYWPNDNNSADNTGATGSQGHSYVSFFAYAPYFDPSSSPASGVKAIGANNVSGAPTVTYTWAADADLLYDYKKDCYKTMTSPGTYGSVGGSVPFIFKHALAKVEFKIRRKDNSGPPVTLKSLSIGLYTSGTFNLGTESWTPTSERVSQTIRSTDLAVTAFTAGTAHSLGSSMLVIPDLKYTINYTIDGNEYTHNNVSITGLNKGNSYTIIFTIDGDVIKVDTERFTEQW